MSDENAGRPTVEGVRRMTDGEILRDRCAQSLRRAAIAKFVRQHPEHVAASAELSRLQKEGRP